MEGLQHFTIRRGSCQRVNHTDLEIVRMISAMPCQNLQVKAFVKPKYDYGYVNSQYSKRTGALIGLSPALI